MGGKPERDLISIWRERPTAAFPFRRDLVFPVPGDGQSVLHCRDNELFAGHAGKRKSDRETFRMPAHMTGGFDEVSVLTGSHPTMGTGWFRKWFFIHEKENGEVEWR